MAELAGTGRHLDPTALRIWTSLLDSGRMLDEILSAHLAEDHKMTHREYEILVRLDGAGGRTRMSVLAAQMVASPSLITQTIERLEAREWVSREASLDDGRGVDAVLLADGRVALAAAAEPHAEIIQRLLIDRQPADALEVVADSLGQVADHLRAHRRGEACGDDECPLEKPWGPDAGGNG